ncbi:serine-type D-Ala-D-Ala carboxypeptidase/endopeptidase (penicillin-binding protein 4) [Frankia sp. AiPs1]|uniref:D-alanyl-D-alanine carboxypeptidase/D-alanyl-D-alanine endopeptidase n=1 Tax=Frankia sp. AiPa1 TaxID=573492 RepID=UPI00202AC307|nr:D-alanyl-D-alanine carboxypeptidase/D-alanyl-D-alanine-endopeptidase [Frankia sp. AiPa1]MCL9761886.1 D-alanyl-D-alanine carboxypeptidase/D-alanyl-D-alanine-endopeptidase [Frankia sp. AiPa1]
MTSAASAARLGGLTAIAGALLAGSLGAGPTTGSTAPPGAAPARPGVAALAGLDPAAPTASPPTVAARLGPALNDPILGGPAAYVVDALSGQVLVDIRGHVPTMPASTLKTAVATAALATFPDTRLRTSVLHSPPPGGGPTTPGGTLWLVGGGDPTLTAAPTVNTDVYPAPARLADLVAKVKAAGITAVARVVGDASLFTGPDRAPGWRDNYVTDGDVSPVTALTLDAGRAAPGATGPRNPTPALAATSAFASALAGAGIQVGSVGLGTAAPSARRIAAVDSPPVRVLVEKMLSESDNDLAESLGRLLARHRGLPASFTGATRAVSDTLAEIGTPTAGIVLSDVSGLSTNDRIPPAALVSLLRTAAVTSDRPELRSLLTGLPVAGFSGTLADRYDTPDTAAGAGEVRAKTGTLRNVTSIAGQVVDTDGRMLLFAFLSPAEEATSTKAALDRLTSALAGCGCRPDSSTAAAIDGGEPAR